MECVLRYRGKNITAAEVQFIQEWIARHPKLSRRALSEKLCQERNWIQANGQPRSMVCRSMMLALHRAGHIQLPPVRFRPLNPLGQRRPVQPLPDRSWEPIETTLDQLGPLEARQVRRTPEEKLFGGLMQAHHYLAYNTRFLILPWTRVSNLGSRLLAQVARVISGDWQRLYHHPIHLLETFIDPQRFRGSCYRAANWRFVGLTTGRGKNDQSNKANRPLKQLWVHPLAKDFRTKLSCSHGTQ